jgi:hypothetical protein
MPPSRAIWGDVGPIVVLHSTEPPFKRGRTTDSTHSADNARYRRVRARKLRQRRWRCVTGAADRRRRDRRPCPCQLRAGGLCAVRGKAPLLICSGAASRRGLPYGGSTRFYGGSTRWQGDLGRFTGLRLRCGDWRAAAGGCHCASLMIKRRAAATALRPCPRPGPGSPPRRFRRSHAWTGRAGRCCRLFSPAECGPGGPLPC